MWVGRCWFLGTKALLCATHPSRDVKPIATLVSDFVGRVANRQRHQNPQKPVTEIFERAQELNIEQLVDFIWALSVIRKLEQSRTRDLIHRLVPCLNTLPDEQFVRAAWAFSRASWLPHTTGSVVVGELSKRLHNIEVKHVASVVQALGQLRAQKTSIVLANQLLPTVLSNFESIPATELSNILNGYARVGARVDKYENGTRLQQLINRVQSKVMKNPSAFSENELVTILWACVTCESRVDVLLPIVFKYLSSAIGRIEPPQLALAVWCAGKVVHIADPNLVIGMLGRLHPTNPVSNFSTRDAAMLAFGLGELRREGKLDAGLVRPLCDALVVLACSKLGTFEVSWLEMFKRGLKNVGGVDTTQLQAKLKMSRKFNPRKF